MLKIIGAMLLRNLLQFLGRELIEILNNKRLQKLAVMAVENVADHDLDNDGKRKHAAAELKSRARLLGIELRDRYINMLIEAAVNNIK